MPILAKPSITAQDLARMVGKPTPVSKDPKARRKSDLQRAVGEIKGILESVQKPLTGNTLPNDAKC